MNDVNDVTEKNRTIINQKNDPYATLEQSVYAALETYSNVHRGSGHYSAATTYLYEQSRKIVMEYMGLNEDKCVVIFCTPARASALIKMITPESYLIIKSCDIGLSLGINAVAVRKSALPKGVPFQTGGGTTKLVSKKWVMWADTPDRFEAGTPAIINIIAFAKALQLVQMHGTDIFFNKAGKQLTALEILHRDELERYSGVELLKELNMTMIGRNTEVPTVEGNRPFINFDNSASTSSFKPVWNTVRQTWRQPVGVQQEIISEVRSICAGMLGAPEESYDILFTSNTTEAINIASEALHRKNEEAIRPVILNTLVEHSSNELPWRMLPGHTLIRMPTDLNGFMDMNELEGILNAYNQTGEHGNQRIEIVAVSGASNVLGVCNDLKEISRIVHKYGARLLVDAAQLVAHRQITMEISGIDILVFSAHKVYAPFGCGVLISRKGQLRFSTDEYELIRSSGEDNAAGIAAMGKSLLLLQRVGMDVIKQEEQLLTAKALRGLSEIKGMTIYGVQNQESPAFTDKLGVIAFALKGRRPDFIAREIAWRGGIGLRTGCHCAHILIKRILNISSFLEQVQRLIQILFPKFRFLGVMRISLGAGNSEEDIDRLMKVLCDIAGAPTAAADGAPHSVTNKKKYTQATIRFELNRFAEGRRDLVFS
ncbi:MAG: aminotransferase class V-fold PLP-dependent enzyme [Bacteroidota bacterium]